MEDSLINFSDNDVVSRGLFLGIFAGISEAIIVRLVLEIFGVFDRTPIFG